MSLLSSVVELCDEIKLESGPGGKGSGGPDSSYVLPSTGTSRLISRHLQVRKA